MTLPPMRQCIFAAALAYTLGLWATAPLSAQGQEPCTLAGERQFAGVPAWVLQCPSAARPLAVYVTGQVRAEDVFKRESGTWIVDAADRGVPSLVVAFDRTGPTGLTASIFHDVDGDRAVGVVADGSGGVRVTESRHPVITIRARDGAWQRDGRISFNLNIDVDGPIPALFGADGGFGLQTHRAYRTDGTPDTTIELHDSRHSGRPGTDLRQGYFGVPLSSGVLRTQLMVDEDAVAAPLRLGSILPFIGDLPYGIVLPHGQVLPPIQVDWTQARVTAIGEFVPSRSTDAGWFVYSLSRVEGAQPAGDFENPFAFYNLAGVRDGYPDLAIRHEYFPPGNPFFDAGRSRISNQLIRYSWDQDHDHRWDFKLDLLGRHLVTSSVRIGSANLATVPYAAFPGWVAEHAWDIMTFVAHESGVVSSEGMYESPLDMLALRDRYLTGKTSAPPAAGVLLPQGFRSEIAIDVSAPPRLYLSAIDRQLHMVGAQSGSQLVSNGAEVRYSNLGGSHVNRWQVVEEGVVTKTLLAAAGQLVLADATGVWIKALREAPALLTVPPPGTSQEWERLGRALREHAPHFAPDDMRAMFDQVAVPVEGLVGATLLDHRLTSSGLRLVIEVRPTDRPSAGGVAPWAIGLASGTYTVDLDGAGVSVALAKAAHVEIVELTALTETGRTLDPVVLRTRLRSTSGQDTGPVTVTFHATRQGSSPIRIGEIAPARLSEDETPMRLSWTPPADGHWRIEMLATWSGVAGAGQAVAAADIVIGPPAPNGLLALLDAQALHPVVLAGLLASLLAACSLAAWLARMAWR